MHIGDNKGQRSDPGATHDFYDAPDKIINIITQDYLTLGIKYNENKCFSLFVLRGTSK